MDAGADGAGDFLAERDQGRSTAHDVFLLPSEIGGGGAGGFGTEYFVRIRRGRNRGCVCQRAGGDRETNFTGQEGAGGIEKTIRFHRCEGLPRAAKRGAAGALSFVQ